VGAGKKKAARGGGRNPIASGYGASVRIRHFVESEKKREACREVGAWGLIVRQLQASQPSDENVQGNSQELRVPWSAEEAEKRKEEIQPYYYRIRVTRP